MKCFVVCFIRKGKCTQRQFDEAPECINYIRRYIGEIKDCEIYPNYYKNADVVKIETENNFITIITPLGEAQKIEDALSK